MKPKELYPVYIVLFSNNTPFAKMIKKMTGEVYSHAVISLDSSLNNMYSFSDVPFNHNSFSGAGFVRESIWSPMFASNKFFTVLVTFVDKDGYKMMSDKIEEFKRNYTKMKYYDIGLIKYYLNFKDTKDKDIRKKQRFFCSEFVAYILRSGKVDGFDDILQAPADIKRTNNPNVIPLGDYTISSFSEAVLIRRTAKAKKLFISQTTLDTKNEEAVDASNAIVTEAGLIDILKRVNPFQKDDQITRYTAILDWKTIYLKFVELFSFSNESIRFNLVELIVRKNFIPNKVSALNTTDKIINEMTRLQKYIKGRVINYIDVSTGEIFVYINNAVKSFKYPDDFK